MAVECTTTGGANGCSYDPCGNPSFALTLPPGTTLLIGHLFVNDGRFNNQTDAKYNGVSLVNKTIVGSGVLWGELGLWYMKNPPTGSSLTFQGYYGSNGTAVYIGAYGFKGVNLNNPFTDVQSKTGCCQTDMTLNLATRPGGMAVLASGWSTSFAWGGGVTGLAGWADNNTDSNPIGGYAAYKAAAAGAVTTIGATTGQWGYCLGHGLRPASGGGGVQVIFERWRSLLRDLREGRLPPDLLQRRYQEAVQI